MIEWSSAPDRRTFFFGSSTFSSSLYHVVFACCRRPQPVPKTPDCRPCITRIRKMRIKWSCASARTHSMERALRSFSWRPTCRPPTTNTYPVRMEIGLQVRLASECHIFSGSSSVVSFMHAHQKAAHKRGIFLDILSRVCEHLLEYPMVLLAGDLNQTAFLLLKGAV